MSFENLFNESFSPPFILCIDSDIDIDEVKITSPEILLNDETLTTIFNTNSQNLQNLHKTSTLWNYINTKTQNNPGIPVCKECNYVFSSQTGNSSMERHLYNKHNITIPKVKKIQTALNFKCINP